MLLLVIADSPLPSSASLQQHKIHVFRLVPSNNVMDLDEGALNVEFEVFVLISYVWTTDGPHHDPIEFVQSHVIPFEESDPGSDEDEIKLQELSAFSLLNASEPLHMYMAKNTFVVYTVKPLDDAKYGI